MKLVFWLLFSWVWKVGTLQALKRNCKYGNITRYMLVQLWQALQHNLKWGNDGGRKQNAAADKSSDLSAFHQQKLGCYLWYSSKFEKCWGKDFRTSIKMGTWGMIWIARNYLLPAIFPRSRFDHSFQSLNYKLPKINVHFRENWLFRWATISAIFCTYFHGRPMVNRRVFLHERNLMSTADMRSEILTMNLNDTKLESMKHGGKARHC